LIIDNRLLAHIDLHEGVEIDADAYDACDFYFKRCIDPDNLPVERLPKLCHFPFVYNVSQSGLDRFEFQRLLKMPVDAMTKAALIARFMVDSTKAQFHMGSRFNWTDLAAAPAPFQEPRALFLTRVSDPNDFPDAEAVEVAAIEAMNEMRAACIRSLRKQFGDRFLGGMARSSFALRYFGDVVVQDEKLTRRRNYLQLVRSHPICITSAGWGGAMGLKFSEYIALSRSIVAQQLARAWPGGINAPDNFLVYRSPEQCVESVGRLMDNADLRRSQMHANWQYFNAWMRPDVFARRIIDTTLGEVWPSSTLLASQHRLTSAA
jgi:hypothetical protein